jgi:WD40 repeat protein
VHYGDETTGEITSAKLYRTADGKPVPLAGDLLNVTFSAAPKGAYFAVAYTNTVTTAAEVRRAADNVVVFDTDNAVDAIEFSPDLDASYFVVYYQDKTTEVRRTAASQTVLVSLSGNMRKIQFSPDPGLTYFLAHYTDGTIEVYRTATAAITRQFISKFKGNFSEQYGGVLFSRDPNATYFAVLYPNANVELRRTANNVVVKTLRQIVRYVQFPDPAGAYLLVYTDEAVELRRTSDGELVPLAGGTTAYEAIFSPDSEATYFVVNYAAAGREPELYLTADGSLVRSFPRDTFVRFVQDSRAPYLLIIYLSGARNGETELRRIDDDQLIATITGDAFVDDVAFSPDPDLSYFISYGSRIELWTTPGTPRRLVQLEGYDWIFDVQNRRLSLVDYNNQAHVLDLALLDQLSTSTALASPEGLQQLACAYFFAPGKFDESALTPYLEGNPPQACR